MTRQRDKKSRGEQAQTSAAQLGRKFTGLILLEGCAQPSRREGDQPETGQLCEGSGRPLLQQSRAVFLPLSLYVLREVCPGPCGSFVLPSPGRKTGCQKCPAVSSEDEARAQCPTHLLGNQCSSTLTSGAPNVGQNRGMLSRFLTDNRLPFWVCEVVCALQRKQAGHTQWT